MPQNAAVRLPGIEPGSSAWEAPMITITLQALCPKPVRREVSLRPRDLTLKQKNIPGGTRTPNLLIRSQTPCPIGPQGHLPQGPKQRVQESRNKKEVRA